MHPSPAVVRTRRIINALFWLAVWAGIVWFTDSWGDWGSMGFMLLFPVMMGAYIHIVLRGRDSPT